MKNVLIAGAGGLVGKELTKRLKEKGYRVSHLSHSKPTDASLNRFHWNPESGFMEQNCLLDIDHVINLAGVGVYDSSWSESYKAQILSSRINATRLLREEVEKSTRVKTFVNASAIGFYGNNTGEVWVDEGSPKGADFLAEVVHAWENEFFKSELKSLRRVVLRLGIVLSNQGGALPQLMKPIQYYVGAPLASGKQYMSWIHIDDVCSQFIWALEQESAQGVYNAVAPNPATNEEITKALAQHLNRKLLLPNIPAFALKLLLGAEKAETLIGGNRVKCNKAIAEGFEFKYKTLNEALHSFFRTD